VAGSATVGARVISADGQSMGKVKEVNGDCFKVDAPMQPDYWLGANVIASAPGEEVRLNVIKASLEHMKLDPAEHRGYHQHS
jgi:uncharacterized protein DUF2171